MGGHTCIQTKPSNYEHLSSRANTSLWQVLRLIQTIYKYGHQAPHIIIGRPHLSGWEEERITHNSPSGDQQTWILTLSDSPEARYEAVYSICVVLFQQCSNQLNINHGSTSSGACTFDRGNRTNASKIWAIIIDFWYIDMKIIFRI